MLIDTHTHLYLDQFADDIDAVIDRVRSNRITALLLPNIDSESYPAMMNLSNANPELCRPMLGLHPCSVDLNWQNQLEELFENWKTETFCAVGEIGLDYYWDKSKIEQQHLALQWQFDQAMKYDKPVSIHCRDAMDDVLKFIEKPQNHSLNGVLHCFTGTLNDGTRAIAQGFYLGLGGVFTFKKTQELRDAIAALPKDRVILETDAPYLAPSPFRGKRNESSYIRHVAEKLADVWQCSYEECCLITTENAKRLFRI